MQVTCQTYHGSCHCGQVRFELDGTIKYVLDCNCSVCRRRGALWHGANDQQVRVTKGTGALILYQFNTLTAKHYFCGICGIHPFARPRLNPEKWVVNVRCIENIDIDILKIVKFNGHDWEKGTEFFTKMNK